MTLRCRSSSTRRRPARVALFALATALSLACPARAFKEHGHATVEAYAYWLLLNELSGDASRLPVRARPAGDVDPPPASPECRLDNEAVSGEQVLKDLIEAGFLEPLAGTQLMARSHHPDQFQERQFSPNGQCYHFMAEAKHTTRTTRTRPLPTARDGRPVQGVPRGLIDDAYTECMGLLDSLLRGAIYSPAAQKDGVRLTYTLLHALEDSFSEAHAARDEGGNWDILYLKPWDILAWPHYLTHPSGWRYYFGESHHTLMDDRDYEYLAPGRVDSCRELTPYQIAVEQPECLGPRGKRAASAVRHLLRLLHELRGCVGKSACSRLDEKWSCFQASHLSHRHLPPREQWRSSWQGFTPWGDVLGPAQEPPGLLPRHALGFAIDSRYRGTYAVWESYGFALPLATDHTSLPQFMHLALQLRLPVFEYSQARPLPLGGAVDLGLGVPVDGSWFQARLGVNALYAEGWVTRESSHAAAGFGGATLSAYFLEHLWIGATGPRALYGTASSDRAHFATFFTFKAGYAWR